MAGRALLLGLAISSLAVSGCAPVQGEEDGPDYPFALTADEVRQARGWAEHHLHVDPRPRSSKDRIYFIKAEPLPESQADSPRRHVMVTHYRYRDDETIHTMIDLVHHQVLKVEKFHQYPTALAPEEVQRAEQLVRRDERLRPLLERQGNPVRLQIRPIQYTDAGHTSLSRRVVQILLVEGDHYLSSPHVLVDLGTDSVVIDQ